MNVLGRQLFKSQRVSLGLLLRSITPALDGFNSNSQLWTSNGRQFASSRDKDRDRDRDRDRDPRDRDRDRDRDKDKKPKKDKKDKDRGGDKKEHKKDRGAKSDKGPRVKFLCEGDELEASSFASVKKKILQNYGIEDEEELEDMTLEVRVRDDDQSVWENLTDIKQLMGKAKEVRIQEMADDYGPDYDENFKDDFGSYENDDDEDGDEYNPGVNKVADPGKVLIRAIEDLREMTITERMTLRKDHEGFPEVSFPDGTIKPTAVWVMKLAIDNDTIRRAIIGNIGGLTHMVETLHMEIWPDIDEQEGPQDPGLKPSVPMNAAAINAQNNLKQDAMTADDFDERDLEGLDFDDEDDEGDDIYSQFDHLDSDEEITKDDIDFGSDDDDEEEMPKKPVNKKR